jgi:hypothetical protein
LLTITTRPYKPGIRSSDHCQQLTTSLTHYPNTTHVNWLPSYHTLKMSDLNQTNSYIVCYCLDKPESLVRPQCTNGILSLSGKWTQNPFIAENMGRTYGFWYLIYVRGWSMSQSTTKAETDMCCKQNKSMLMNLSDLSWLMSIWRTGWLNEVCLSNNKQYTSLFDLNLTFLVCDRMEVSWHVLC